MSLAAFKLPTDPDSTVGATLYPPDGERNLDALFVFAHGAGAGQAHPFMTSYAAALAARGITVVTFNFPYMENKRRTPDRAPVLEDAFRRAVAAALEHREINASKLFIGGKSMGGRVASMIADDAYRSHRIAGLLCLGYPFHPPAKPTQLRTRHLAHLETPTLVVQGTRDEFGTRDEVESYRLSDRIDLLWLEDGDHDLKPRKSVSGFTTADHLATVAGTVVAWSRRLAR